MIMLIGWIHRILSSTVTENVNHSTKAKHKRRIAEAPIDNNSDYSECCRICYFQSNNAKNTQNSTNISKKVKYSQAGIIKYAKRIHKWSLIQLVNPSGNVSHPLEKLFLPAHLSCSLMIITLYGNLSNNWLEQFCDAISQPSSNQPLSSCIGRLELIWLKNVIKTITMISENTGDGLAIKVDGEEIYPGACFDTNWLYEYVRQSMPECALKYVGTVLTSTAEVIVPMSWNKILNNPYLFYCQYCAKFDDVFKMYGLPESKTKINEEIYIMLKRIYTAEENDLLNCDPLQIIFIIHLIYENQLENNSYSRFNTSFEYFKAKPSLNNFQKLIFNLGIQNSMQYRVTLISHFKWFKTFITNYENANYNVKMKVINFWIAKMVLFMRYKHLYFLCYILFKENLMEHFSTWMVFRCSLLIKRLLIMRKKGDHCTFEKTSRIQKNYHQMCHFSIGSCEDMFNDIRHSLLLFQGTCHLDRIEKLKEKSIRNTYTFCKHTYQVVIDIINIRNAMQ